MKIEDVEIGAIVECHLSGYWIVESIFMTEFGMVDMVALRLIINGNYSPVKNSSKTHSAHPMDITPVTLSHVADLRERLNIGVRTLEAYVEASPAYKGLLGK